MTPPRNSKEQLCLANFTSGTISDRQGLASVVNEQLLAGRMRLSHADRQLAGPLPVMITESAIEITIRVIRFVLLPQQVEGDALLAHLSMRPCPVWL